jgi:hypothetical protein
MSARSRIVVTGGAGFIGGSTLADRLVSDGREVIAVDGFDPFYPRPMKENNIARARRNPARCRMSTVVQHLLHPEHAPIAHPTSPVAPQRASARGDSETMCLVISRASNDVTRSQCDCLATFYKHVDQSAELVTRAAATRFGQRLQIARYRAARTPSTAGRVRSR